MKHRFVLAFMALLVIGSFAGATAQTYSEPREVVDMAYVDVPAGVTSFRFGHLVPSDGSDWYQLVFTPRKPLAYGFREIKSGVGLLRFTEPTTSAVRIEYSVIRYSP